MRKLVHQMSIAVAYPLGVTVVRFLLAFAVVCVYSLAASAHDGLDAQIARVTAQIAANATSAELFVRRGELHRAARHWSEALADLDRAASLDPMLMSASTGAGSYEYCYDKSNDNQCAGTWISTATSRQVSIGSLTRKTAYYWQVRATNAQGTTLANSAVWWKFTTR